MNDNEMTALIADSMEQGLAENVLSLLRKEPDYIRLIPDLLQDERARVRLGTMIVIEDFARESPESFQSIIRNL